MEAALKELHQQQALIKLAIERLENFSKRSPRVSPWPWIKLIVFLAVGLGVDSARRLLVLYHRLEAVQQYAGPECHRHTRHGPSSIGL